jgi:ankyrin repeat protein
MNQELSVNEASHLLALCAAGRLYAIEEWVRDGRSLRVPRSAKRTPLEVAFATGFHSLIELLLRHASDQETKNVALDQAIERRRVDLVELAVAYGADITTVPFVDVLMTADRGIIGLFLEQGADLIGGHPFAHALCRLRAKTTLGTYLDTKRQHPELAQQLQAQLDLALRQFCHDGNLKSVSLLMWAGADPRSRGPRLEYADDSDMDTTAFHEACVWGHTEIVKRLKPNANRDEFGEFLKEAAFFAHRETLAYLVGLGANPNDRTDGGSSALEACVRRLGFEDHDRVLHRLDPNYLTPKYKLWKTLDSLRFLVEHGVEHGAVWKPDAGAINDARKIFYKLEPDVAVQFIALLVRHKACDDPVLREFLRPPRMQQHLAGCGRQMARLGLMLDGRRTADVPKVLRPTPYVLATYSREKLFEEVWIEPTQKVAARYGISDVALTKVCRQLQIPKPPRGYWAKLAARRRVPRRPKLPPLET